MMRFVLALCLVLAGCGRVVKDEDAARFRADLGKTSVTVYPAVVRGLGAGSNVSWDEASANQLAAWVESKNLAKTAVAADRLQIAAKPGMNQAKMFRSSFASFGAWVKDNPPGTEYAAVAEYLVGRNGQVGGVHVYVVSKDGTPVYGTLLNSHWKELKQINPKSISDATRVAILKLNRDLIEKR
jgi:hypothetical protein